MNPASRVYDVLEYLARQPGGVQLSQLARDLGIPKSSAWGIIKTSIERGYVREAGRELALGPRLFEIGVRGHDAQLRAVGRQVLEALSEDTGETAFLATLTPDEQIVKIDKVVSRNLLRYDTEIGVLRPAHCTASGKVLLAFLPEDRIERYLESRSLERFTGETITAPDRLRRELADIRRDGIAINREELVLGACAIAAPVRLDGRVVASVLIGGPKFRMLPRLDVLKGTVIRAAVTMTNLLSAAAGDAPPARKRA